MATAQYIGARYVPLFFTNPDDSSNNWKSGIAYDPLTIVSDLNQSYTSKIPVPATVGRPSENPTYWVLTGAYSAQVEQYRQEVAELDGNVSALSNSVNELSEDVRDLESVEPFACVLRKNNGVWEILPASSGHTPLHITGVTEDTAAGVLRLTFDKTYSSVGGISITPDETYGLAGLGAGASLGTSVITIHLYRTRQYSGWFDFTSAGAISYPTPILQYKGDIDNVTYNSANNLFLVTFKNYVTGGAFNYMDVRLSKDAINSTPSSIGSPSTSQMQFQLAGVSGMVNGGRAFVTAAKNGYDIPPADFPNIEYGNFWITGYMIP